MAKSHKDVEFAVNDASGKQTIFPTFNEAAAFAVGVASSTGRVNLDILVWSKAGANWLMGDAGVEMYNEDPEASVFERYEIRVNNLGRVP